MEFEAFRNFCLQKKGVTEEFPFDEKTVAFKVLGKVFAYSDIENFDEMVLKCDPDKALELRASYPSILPGYHSNKKHWNSVLIDGSLSEKFIFELISHSYDEVVKKLPKKLQAKLLA
jgi:predicted DNA-binding protein (MmcQ/YjbR family)